MCKRIRLGGNITMKCAGGWACVERSEILPAVNDGAGDSMTIVLASRVKLSPELKTSAWSESAPAKQITAQPTLLLLIFINFAEPFTVARTVFFPWPGVDLKFVGMTIHADCQFHMAAPRACALRKNDFLGFTDRVLAMHLVR